MRGGCFFFNSFLLPFGRAFSAWHALNVKLTSPPSPPPKHPTATHHPQPFSAVANELLKIKHCKMLSTNADIVWIYNVTRNPAYVLKLNKAWANPRKRSRRIENRTENIWYRQMGICNSYRKRYFVTFLFETEGKSFKNKQQINFYAIFMKSINKYAFR